MPLVNQSTFDQLLKNQAIAETGEVLYTIKHDGGTYLPGGEKFTVTQPSEEKTQPSEPKPTPKAVATPARATKTTKATEKEEA